MDKSRVSWRWTNFFVAACCMSDYHDTCDYAVLAVITYDCASRHCIPDEAMEGELGLTCEGALTGPTMDTQDALLAERCCRHYSLS